MRQMLLATIFIIATMFLVNDAKGQIYVGVDSCGRSNVVVGVRGGFYVNPPPVYQPTVYLPSRPYVYQPYYYKRYKPKRYYRNYPYLIW